MSMISLDEAATRLGLSPEAIEEWAKKGLLHVHTVVTSATCHLLLWDLW